MSTALLTKLRISPELQLPVDAVTETFGILAVKRAGKSNAAVAIAEEMFKAGLPWVAIDPKGDWWGIRSSGDGKGPGLPIVVFGGLHADVPLEPGAGQLVADLVVDQRLTCVIDVSEMTKADQRRFLTAFVRRLYQRNREPLHVFCEEADEYIPQMVRGDAAEMVGVFETLVKRGGFRGLGCTLITQRSASLNNDVLTQIQTLFALRTTGVPDRKRIEEWVNYHQAGKEFVQQLPTLADGEALVFSPNFLRTVVKIRFRRRETFDSGATPKVGVKARPPAILADVDLARLREQMASTIEKAKADDPRELRKRIQELERQLHQRTRDADTQQPKIVEKIVEVPIFDQRIVLDIQVAVENYLEGKGLELLRGVDAVIATATQGARSRLPSKDQLHGRVAKPAVGAGAGGLTSTPASSARPVRPAEPRSDKREKGGDFISGDITRPQQRILDALAKLEAVYVTTPTRIQVAGFADASPKSSGFENNVSRLSSLGLISYPGPGRVSLTEAGRAAAAPVDRPPTTEEFQGYIFRLLSSPQAELLKQLIRVYPDGLTRAELADAAGVSALSSGFENNVSRLSSFGFARYPQKGSVAADPVLFLEEVARR